MTRRLAAILMADVVGFSRLMHHKLLARSVVRRSPCALDIPT